MIARLSGWLAGWLAWVFVGNLCTVAGGLGLASWLGPAGWQPCRLAWLARLAGAQAGLDVDLDVDRGLNLDLDPTSTSIWAWT